MGEKGETICEMSKMIQIDPAWWEMIETATGPEGEIGRRIVIPLTFLAICLDYYRGDPSLHDEDGNTIETLSQLENAVRQIAKRYRIYERFEEHKKMEEDIFIKEKKIVYIQGLQDINKHPVIDWWRHTDIREDGIYYRRADDE